MRGVVKRFICCFMVMIIMASIVGSFDVNAASINERIKEHIDKPYVDKVHIDKDMSHILAKDGGVSVKEELVVRDIKIPLYATFDAPDKAIDNIASNKLVMELKKYTILKIFQMKIGSHIMKQCWI